LLEGSGLHRDSLGNVSTIATGEAQWMRAGSGILHGEGADEALRRNGGRLHGVQFWINLPTGLKMSPPRYRAVARAEIPEIPLGDGSLRLIAGALEGLRGPIDTYGNPWLALFDLPASAIVTIAVDVAELGLYVVEGTVQVGLGRHAVSEGHLAVLTEGDSLQVHATSGAKAFILGGDPLDASIRRWGPFVMNTDDELQQAMRDYQAGLFGTIPPPLDT
jgi:redox-sensitive bicupin YhaK (pirin superfamily)